MADGKLLVTIEVVPKEGAKGMKPFSRKLNVPIRAADLPLHVSITSARVEERRAVNVNLASVICED